MSRRQIASPSGAQPPVSASERAHWAHVRATEAKTKAMMRPGDRALALAATARQAEYDAIQDADRRAAETWALAYKMRSA